MNVGREPHRYHYRERVDYQAAPAVFGRVHLFPVTVLTLWNRALVLLFIVFSLASDEFEIKNAHFDEKYSLRIYRHHDSKVTNFNAVVGGSPYAHSIDRWQVSRFFI